jgi:hypothetical protein
MESVVKKRRFYGLTAALLCICLLMGSSTAVWAGSGKAARIKEKFLTGDENEDRYYAVSFGFNDRGKIGKKNYFSGKVVIQKSFLSQDGDSFFLYPAIECIKSNGVRAGFLYSKNMIFIIKNRKKYEAYFIAGGSIKETGQKVNVKASSKEITICVKNLPLYADKSLTRKKSYTLAPTVFFMTGADQKTKKYVDIDEVTLTAEKKHTSTFDKKDYKYLHATSSDGFPVNVKVVNR